MMRGLGAGLIGNFEPTEPQRSDYQRNYKGLRTTSIVKPFAKLRESCGAGKLIPDPYCMNLVKKQREQHVLDLTQLGSRGFGRPGTAANFGVRTKSLI